MEKDNLRHINDSNMDEFMFELTGNTHRGFFWRTWLRLRWKVRDWRNKRSLKEIRQFLHKDLQGIRGGWFNWEKEWIRVRYTDKHGDLYSRKFTVKTGYGYLQLAEVKGDIPLRVRGTKGPRTLKNGYLVSSRYYWCGLRKIKVWSIPYKSML